MVYFTKDISADYKKMGCAEPKKSPRLTAYILGAEGRKCSYSEKRPAVIVCPGGGYEFTYPGEAEAVALKYFGAGFNAFVLDYSCNPTGWPAACCELSKSIAYVREIADEYDIDKDKIIVCGFSAGGHLAASIGVHYDKAIVKENSDIIGDENKPNGMILCYPVITDDINELEIGTYNNFCLGHESAKEYFGLEHFVNKDTPKAFIWHTFEDAGVPVENSMRFASALIKNNVNIELHIFPKGGHGLSLANKLVSQNFTSMYPEIEPWIDMSCRWIDNL